MATQSKQKKLKGGRQKLKLFRANEPLKSVLMWGINHSVTTLQHTKPRAVLLKDDFKAYLKVKVKTHLFNKENMPSRFKFKEYCPLVFQNLRERFSVDTTDYWESFTRYQPLWDTVSGKSGSKLLVTYNRHYVLKTISSEEVEQMHHFIENYHEGSVVDREANEKEKSKPLPTLKDNDFMNDICELHLEENSKKRLLEHLKRDIAFLQDNNVMDYSALIGIHDVELAAPPFSAPSNAADATNGTEEPSSGLVVGASSGSAAGSPSTMEVAAGVPTGHQGSRGGGEVLASAGDGLGEIFEERLFGGSNAFNHHTSVVTAPLTTFSGGGYNDPFPDFSPPNSEDFENMASGSAEEGNMTPPESPNDTDDDIVSHRFQPFVGELNPVSEFYAFKGAASLGRPVIYFIALIDILTRYGMRKRTAQTYKTVKHGGANADQITTVRPEVYGRRLLDFLRNCIEK